MSVYRFFSGSVRQVSVKNFLLRYLISVIFCLLFLYLVRNSLIFFKELNLPLFYFILFLAILNTLLFPFSKIGLDTLLDYFIGGHEIYIPRVIHFMLTLIYLIICWLYALLFGMIGLIGCISIWWHWHQRLKHPL